MTDSQSHLFPHGRLSYVHIPAVDLSQLGAFYERIFGWSVRDIRRGQRSFTDASGDMIGAFVTDRPVSRDGGAVLYIYVHGIDAVLERILAEGGTLARPPYPEGDLWVATVHDPAGNEIGIWQQGR